MESGIETGLPPSPDRVDTGAARGLGVFEAIRYLERTFPDIHANLALDEALLIEAEERGTGPIVRVWEPDAPAVVLGASCRLAEDVDVEACREAGIAIARRSSGGGTVLIGPGCLNVTVVLPADAAPGLGAVDTAQAFVLDRIAAALRERGPAVAVLGLGDLTIGRRKFAGSAQRRLKRTFLVHLCILHNFDLGLVSRYTTLPRRQPAYRGQRSHDEFLINAPLDRATLLASVRSAWSGAGPPVARTDYPEDLVRHLVATKFADPAWIERF
jgi:lipoate-protein ligase A